MKKRTFTFIFGALLAGSAVLAQPCANSANIYSFSFYGKTYEVVKEMKTWENAVACALERGGYLVEIGDQSEQAAVYNAIINAAGIALAGWPSGTTLLGIPGEWNDISTANLMYFVIEYDYNMGLNDTGKQELQIFPNPASGLVKIQYSGEPIVDVKVFSSLGKLVYRKDWHRNEISIDLRNFSYGVYTVSVSLGNGNVLSRKIILSF